MPQVCAELWVAPRFETGSMPINHVCKKDLNHDPPCECSCGAVREVLSIDLSDTEKSKIPAPGTPINLDDINNIIEAIVVRQGKFREESLRITISVVLANIGDRFAPVICVGGEWEGIKADFPPEQDMPKCPNGHVCMQGKGLELGWVTPL